MNYINNAWITSTAIITTGMITNSYLKGIQNLHFFHLKKKYNNINQNSNNNDNESINSDQETQETQETNQTNNNDKITKYYWNHYIATYIIAITGIITIATITTKYKK